MARVSSSVGIGWSSARLVDSVKATYTPPPAPEVLVGAIVDRVERRSEGSLIVVLQPAWDAIGKLLRENSSELPQLSPEQWEELIAGAYDKAGYDEVVLTPRSGDGGRDIIAVKRGWHSIRIIDQVKAYAPGHAVPANDVRALIGVMLSDPLATKGIVTTTSTFAPRVLDDPHIAQHVPFRLELHDGEEVRKRLLALTSDDR